MRAGDEEFQGAGDDFEFDGKAGERLAIDLGVERIFVEGLADDGVSFVEMDALSAAEIAHPEESLHRSLGYQPNPAFYDEMLAAPDPWINFET